jgi:MerR family transcriptional regulator, light-induced transcriptional regulator
MSSYPISAAAKLTGIPLDTLRAWERRYSAVVPLRSARGRVYSADQIKRLILLRQVVEQGHAIGQVAAIKNGQLRQLLDGGNSFAAKKTIRKEKEAASHNLLLPILREIERFDYAATDREINRLAAAVASPRDFVHLAALPLMRIIGDRWHAGKCSIAQEHMLTNLLSALLASMVRTYSPTNPPARVLLATPRNERHGFANLAAAMLTAVGGLGVIYLGSDLPAADIVWASRKSDADVVLLSLSSPPGPDLLQDFDFIARKTQRSTALWLGGPPALGLERATAGSRWLVLNDFVALEQQLSALGARF